MKQHRFFVLLAVALICCLAAGCDASDPPAVKDVTLVIKTPMQEMNALTRPEIRNVPMFLEQAGRAFAASYDRARVTPVIKIFNYVDEARAVTGSFDTENAPDVLFGAFFNMASYIHTGRVVPLDDDITEALRNDIDARVWEMSMIGGKTYMMPFLNMQNILIYNKELFRKCGLDAYIGAGTRIRDWTIGEWETILDTLAAKLPEGVYPLAMFGKNNQGDTHILSYLRAFGGSVFDSDGNFDFTDGRIVRALTWLRNGVDRGWYPPHPENLEMKDCSELFANGQLAVYMFNNANRALYSDLNHYGFVNYPGNIATMFVNGFEVFDNGDADRLQAARAFLRYIYETDEWLDLSAGNMPVSGKVLGKYADRIAMLNDFSANAVHVVDFMRNSPNWQGRENSFRAVFWPHIHDLLAGATSPEECAAALNAACNAALDWGRKNSSLHP